MSPIDELLKKCTEKSEAFIREAALDTFPPSPSCPVSDLCAELEEAMLRGESSISKTVVDVSYTLELTKQEALDLKENLANLLGYTK